MTIAAADAQVLRNKGHDRRSRQPVTCVVLDPNASVDSELQDLGESFVTGRRDAGFLEVQTRVNPHEVLSRPGRPEIPDGAHHSGGQNINRFAEPVLCHADDFRKIQGIGANIEGPIGKDLSLESDQRGNPEFHVTASDLCRKLADIIGRNAADVLQKNQTLQRMSTRKIEVLSRQQLAVGPAGV